MCVYIGSPLAHRVNECVSNIDLIALDPFVEGLGHAADLGRDEFDGCPQRRVLALVFTQQANGAHPYLG